MKRIVTLMFVAVLLAGCSRPYLPGAWPELLRQRGEELRKAASLPGNDECDVIFLKHADFIDTFLTAAGEPTRADAGGL